MANTPTLTDVPHMPVATHDEAAFQQQEGAHGGSLIYWLVGLVLGVVTILEVFASGLWFSSIVMLLILVSMAVLKGALIIAVFMHMQGDAGIFKFAFFAPFTIATSFLLIFLLLFSTHVGIAG